MSGGALTNTADGNKNVFVVAEGEDFLCKTELCFTCWEFPSWNSLNTCMSICLYLFLDYPRGATLQGELSLLRRLAPRYTQLKYIYVRIWIVGGKLEVYPMTMVTSLGSLSGRSGI